MYMNSAPHLRIEDRPEFERALDEALRDARTRPEFLAAGKRLDNEQLRNMALSASAAIAACAAAEYQDFTRLREQLRRPERSSTGSTADPADRGPTPRGGMSLGLAGGIADTGGAGLFAVITVLAPVLAGAAAIIFLTVGYLLHLLSPEPALAQPMRDVGWVFAALTAAGILIATVGLLITALRNPPSSAIGDEEQGGLAEEVALARAAWRQALLERGIVPFLREAAADAPDDRLPEPTPSPSPPSVPEQDRGSRTPRLGYSHPGFTSPAGDASEPHHQRPSFSSPDFSSPDFGSPDHTPD